MSPPSSVSSSESIASAFFVQKKHSSSPVRTLYFPSNDDEEQEEEQDGEREEEQDEEDRERRERRMRLVEVACKGNFCFPEGELRDSSGEKSSSLNSCYYTFGLTDQDGKRHFGFVLRWRRGSSSEENKKSNGTMSNEERKEDLEKEEIAMCVLSSRRFYGLFEQILRAALPSAEKALEEGDVESFALASSELGVFLRATLGASVSGGRRLGGGKEEGDDVLVVPSPNAEPSLRLRVPGKEEREDLACFDAFLYGSSDDEEVDERNNSKNLYNDIKDKKSAVASGLDAAQKEEEARAKDRKYGKQNVVPSDAIVALFVALLFERRVVLTSKSLSKLSRATHAANRMVFPLKWQHVFLPLVPSGLMDYLTAPMPFVVGLPLQLMSAYEKVPKEEVFLLNLDDGSYTYFEEDFELVPKRIVNKLQKTLERERELGRREHRRRRLQNLPPLEETQPRVTLSAAATSASATTTMEEVVSKAFRTFLSSAIGSYPRFVKSVALEKPPPEAISNDGLWLDQDAFVEGAPNHRTRLFRVSLRHTQMYEVFVRDRLRACAIAARSGKAQFGSDVKDEDLDEESALVAFGSEFQKEAKSVYRETQRIAKISAIGMKKGAKLVKEKFSTSLDAFKERRQRMKSNLSSESLEVVADTTEGGDLEWKRIDKTKTNTTSAPTTISRTITTTVSNKAAKAPSSEDDESEDDDDATIASAENREYELKCASERAAKRQQDTNDAIMDEATNNLIDFFDDIVLGASSPPASMETTNTSNPAPPAVSLLDL
jgi:hypothetical protein